MCVLTQITCVLIRRVETHRHTERRKSGEDEGGDKRYSVEDCWQFQKLQEAKEASSLESSKGLVPALELGENTFLAH